MSHTLTPQQQALLDSASTPENILGVARAGTGKTYIEVLMAEAMEQKILALAFNKNIAVELGERMPSWVECKTTHSFGLGALYKALPKVKVNGDKHKIIRKKLEAFGHENFKSAWGLLKSMGYVPERARDRWGFGGLVDNAISSQDLVDALADNNGLELLPDSHKVLDAALLWSIEKVYEEGLVDFDDMLYIPVVAGMPLRQFMNVMVDEAQDLNAIQHAMIRMILHPQGKLIAAGDDRQAIYGFRGAVHSSLDILKREFNMKTLPLTVSFRCPKLVVEEARQYVCDIEAAADAPDGIVDSLPGYDHTDFPEGSAVLCRNNAPLVKLCFRLIRQGVGAQIRGREVGDSLKNLVMKIAKPEGGRQANLGTFRRQLGEWFDERTQFYAKRGAEGKIQALSDRYECLIALMEQLDTDGRVGELLDAIWKIFNNKEALITLSTIHKAKGLEWPRVFFLDRFLIPSRYAKTPAQQLQEENLAYVATTRAMAQLTYIQTEGWTA